MVTQDIAKYYLYPSTLIVAERETMVDTVLGSCVSLCLFDRKKNIGGINHFMLPLWNGEGLASPRYGNIANEKLLSKMLSMGCKRDNMVAKIFGGANQFSSMNVGERNIAIAREFLVSSAIALSGENVGGACGRKLRFNTSTGEAWMMLLGKKQNEKG